MRSTNYVIHHIRLGLSKNKASLYLDFIYLKNIELARYFEVYINFLDLIENTCKKIKRANSITNEINEYKKLSIFNK